MTEHTLDELRDLDRHKLSVVHKRRATPLIPATAARAVMTLPIMLVVDAIYGATPDQPNNVGRNLFLRMPPRRSRYWKKTAAQA